MIKPEAMKTGLPSELKSLVHEVSNLWGEVIFEEAGRGLFQKVEDLREFLKVFRKKTSFRQSFQLCRRLQTRMHKLSPQELIQVTHSFSVLLELTNICENSVRSLKLRQRQKAIQPPVKCNEIYLVLTAHPTESRAAEMVETLNSIQRVISLALFEGNLNLSEKLKPLLRRLWHLRMAKQKKPEVRDEANYLYSILFQPETLAQLLGPAGEQLFLRTWVGGDKDGHPGVDEKVMLESLQGSRTQIMQVLQNLISNLQNELLTFQKLSPNDLANISQRALRQLRPVQTHLRSLQRLQANDALRVEKWKISFAFFLRALNPSLQKSLIHLQPIQRLIQMFPSFVIPLELREDSQVFRDFQNLKSRPAIFRMLQTLQKISGGRDPRGYARGLIISMCQSLEDLQAAEFFLKKAFGPKPSFPIIPLFEKSRDLKNGHLIAEAWIRQKKLKKFEVMLGYSDSSKEGGVLPSRIAIRNAIFEFEKLSRRISGLQLTYFHGTGGSVDRGGGSIENQTAHWPPVAFERYKVTLQGEMIQRTFSTPDIFHQYLSKIRLLCSQRKKHRILQTSPALLSFSEEISHFYRESVSDPLFLKMVEKASAYRFLEELRIGSRPAKRKKLEGLSSLRAIPWILAWTQTRILLPTWWGFGTAYSHMNPSARKELRRLARGQDPLFTSYLQQLGFTLAKIELAIWFLYLEQSSLSALEKEQFYQRFQNELKLTHKAFEDLTGKKDVLWFKPWLQESIRLRSPLIHPLNIAQLKAWKNGDFGLLREASVGIACGMLTTG
ncbi:MAG: phosphoenolpyruvate carboxylase [Pseudobdellovibrionaceae bacterium]